MTDKTNEEKLRILQERLSAIKQKETTKQEAITEEQKPAAPVFEENLANEQPKKESNSENNKGSFWKIIFFLIFFSFLGAFVYYLSANDFKIDSTIENIKKDVTNHSKKISSLFGENDKNKDDIVEDEVEDEFILEYNLKMPGEKIAIIGSFPDKRSAKIMVNDLKVKGYKCHYFFLPKESNSKKEVYKVFIGPYENKEETNQWTKNLELDFEIIKL